MAKQKHAWIIENLISVIAYADNEGLDEVSRVLSRAIPKISSSLVQPLTNAEDTGNLVDLTKFRAEVQTRVT